MELFLGCKPYPSGNCHTVPGDLLFGSPWLAPLLVAVVLEKGLHFLWAMFMVLSLADQPEQGLVALQPHRQGPCTLS